LRFKFYKKVKIQKLKSFFHFLPSDTFFEKISEPPFGEEKTTR